jgi:hypothetical protein
LVKEKKLQETLQQFKSQNLSQDNLQAGEIEQL